MKFSSRLLIIMLAICCSGCELDVGMRSLGSTEYGVVFRKLPTLLGGGLSKAVKQPGQTFFVWPWDSVYTLDTRVRTIDWGDKNSKTLDDWVQTRALDGNEVLLAVRIQYQLATDSQKLRTLIQTVGTSDEAINEIVNEAARADIRQYMNKLKTEDFISDKAKFQGQRDVQENLSARLEPFGIIIRSVNLKEHRFARVGADGSVDEKYQELINQVQIIEEETLREKSRRETLIERMRVEFNRAQGEVNELLESAAGYSNQAQARGDAYFKTKSNEAKAILAKGKADVQGMREKIAALNGPGGEALLKLELSKALVKNKPQFVLMGGGGGSEELQVNKVDTNKLLNQIGIVEALREDAAARASSEKKANATVEVSREDRGARETAVTESPR